MLAWVVLVPVIWCFAGFVLAGASGWLRFADRYRAADRFSGPTRYWESIRVGVFDYLFSVNLGFGRSKLHLRTILPVRAFHPPRSIPYGRIDGVEYRSLLGRRVSLQMGDVTVKVSPDVAGRMQSASESSWHYRRLGP